MKKMILKLLKIFYSYIIEPIIITILLLIALIPVVKKKLIKTFKNYWDSPHPLVTCVLLSIINRIIIQLFVKEFGLASLLFIALVTAVVSTLFKVTIRIWKNQNCSIDRIFTLFVISFGISLLFTLIFAIIRFHWL